MRGCVALLIVIAQLALVSSGFAQSGGNRAGFSPQTEFSGRSGGYQPGFGNFGYLGPATLPQAGIGVYGREGVGGFGEVDGVGNLGVGRGNGLGAYGAGLGAGLGSGQQGFGTHHRDDGVRLGGQADNGDLGHGVHLGTGSGAVGASPYGAGGGNATGPYVSPAYGNEQWHPNYFPGD